MPRKSPPPPRKNKPGQGRKVEDPALGKRVVVNATVYPDTKQRLHAIADAKGTSIGRIIDAGISLLEKENGVSCK